MNGPPAAETAIAISAILERYRNYVTTAATTGNELRVVTPEEDRPDLIIDGDGNGRAMIAICTHDGYRHIVFTRWPDGDSIHPEHWPAAIPVQEYSHSLFSAGAAAQRKPADG